MFVTHLKVRNFKSFSEEEWSFIAPFTVIVGENASGKTTILDALAVAAGSFIRGIDVARSNARPIYTSEIRVRTIDNQPRPQLPSEIITTGPVMPGNKEITWTRDVVQFTKKTTTRFAEARNIERLALSLLNQSRLKGNTVLPVFAYHGTGRLWAQHEQRTVDYTQQGEGVAIAYANCLSPKSSARDFLSWYKTYEDTVRKFDNKRDIELLEALKETIISMLPQNQWNDIAFNFLEDDLMGWFLNPNGERECLRFGQLSDGYRNLIGMVADIAYRCINLNPHLGREAVKKTPGLVLIDELDLHLHPNWQRRVVDDLKKAFPAIQFICTTHSPFIVQSLRSEELINLDKITDVNYQDLTIGEVATRIMGAQSEFSEQNQKNEDLSDEYLKALNSEEHMKMLSEGRLEDIASRIMDPGLRAFLKLQRLNRSNRTNETN